MSENNSEGRRVGRREFVQMSSTVAAFGAASIPAAGQKARSYQGIAYDTRTHEIHGTARATFLPSKDELKGTLEVGPHKLRLEHDEPTNRKTKEGIDQRTFRTLLDGPYSDEGYPLDVKVVRDNRNETLAGYMTRPAPVHGKMGFSLVPADDFHSQRQLEEQLVPETAEDRVGIKDGVPVYDPVTNVEDTDSPSRDSSTQDVSTSAQKDVCTLSEDDEYIANQWKDYNDRCGTDFSQTGTFQMVNHADGETYQGADEVNRYGSNQWHVQSYWPYRLNYDRVDLMNEHTAPDSVEFHAQVGTDSSYTDYEGIDLEEPTPNRTEVSNGDGGNDGFFISGGIDLSPVPFLSASVGYSYNFDFEDTSTLNTGYNYDGDYWDTGNYYYWDLVVNGASPSDYPKKPADGESWGVKFDVSADQPAGTSETVVPKSRCTYFYYAYELDVCPSPTYGVTAIFKDTPLLTAPNTFDVV